MHKRKLKFCTLLGMALIFTGCSNYDIPESQKSTIDENSSIYELIQKFQIADSQTRGETFRIKSVEKVSYDPHEILSDSIASLSIESLEPFELKNVTLDFGGTKGYAIVSDDERLNYVFLYSSNGCISDTAYIKPLKMLIDSYPVIAANMLAEKKTKQTRATNTITQIVSPIVRYEWGQFSPFNDYAVYCTCKKCSNRGNHTPAGCVTTAVAQTIATLGTFNGTFYGTRNIDFSKMPNSGNNMTAAQRNQIGHFFQEIALNCQIKYACDGSGTTLKAAYNYLKDLGYSCQYTEGEINHPKAIELLKKGIPILCGGMEKGESVGHAWVVDGIRIVDGHYEYYCNWGWNGTSNCWSPINDSAIRDKYTGEVTKQYEKLKHIYINDKLK